ncbi:MAG: metallopeptidase TldD-related protein [Planctomycetota bacterium]
MLLSAATALAQEDVVIDALADELERSMTLQLEGEKSPYFIEYVVAETASHRISATCGAIVTSDASRSRRLFTEVRVGYYDVDNTNFAGGGRGFGQRFRGRGRGGRVAGGTVALPTDDSYTAIRHAAWRATDGVYKQAVETLARKQAYMEERNLPDRPDDFSRVDALGQFEPLVELNLAAPAWEQRLRAISRRLLEHAHLLDSDVSLAAIADNRYLVNSEGSRVRTGTTSFVLTVNAVLQASDGELISDRLVYHAASPDQLPTSDDVLDDVDEMALGLAAKAGAPVLEDYVGPVLFDGGAAPQVIHALLARGVAGRAEPVGGGRRRFTSTETLEKYLNKRILPRTFQVYDDPRQPSFGDEMLTGHYSVDDEGVPAQRVDLVVDGKLVGMVMSRAPTQHFGKSTGHGRGTGGRTQAGVGCLYVETSDGQAPDALTGALIEAVFDQDLDYGIRVTSIGRPTAARAMPAGFPGGGRAFPGGGGGLLGDPIAVFKVYTDGREELVRGCEFGDLGVSHLRDIVAAGRDAAVHNAGRGGTGSSVVAPPLLFEEVELFTIEEEREGEPIVTAPHRRAGGRDTL